LPYRDISSNLSFRAIFVETEGRAPSEAEGEKSAVACNVTTEANKDAPRMNDLRKDWPHSRLCFTLLMLALSCLGTATVYAQTCLTASDMDESTRTALVNTAKRYFDMAARGDSSALRENSVASVAADFSGIESAIKDNQSNFSAGQANPRSPFLLEAEGKAPLERAEFLCGVFGASGQTANSAEFLIPDLPPGNYGIVTLDVPTAKGSYAVTFVLQQKGTDWKVGGFYVNAPVKGHDGQWFAEQARTFKTKGQSHNAWFYYLEARQLLVPVPFMDTQVTDKLDDEFQNVKPADLPGANPVDLAANGKTYKLTALFPLTVGADFDLVVKYQSADISNTAQTFQDNASVMKALVAKYPEFRDAFDGVVARAVEPSGKDYGSLLPMKDIK